MNRFARLALACTAALAVSLPSYAGVIVDTGAGDAAYGGIGLFHGQSVANSFTLADAETITGVNGWLGGNTGTLRIGIRSADNTLPGALLFAADAAPTEGPNNSWVGASGLDWMLAAGTYFVSFEVPDGYTFGGGMGQNVPNPTGTGAFTDDNGVWHNWGNPHVGVQVFGDAAGAAASTSVPEPSTPALAGLALVALAVARRKRA